MYVSPHLLLLLISPFIKRCTRIRIDRTPFNLSLQSQSTIDHRWITITSLALLHIQRSYNSSKTSHWGMCKIPGNCRFRCNLMQWDSLGWKITSISRYYVFVPLQSLQPVHLISSSDLSDLSTEIIRVQKLIISGGGAVLLIYYSLVQLRRWSDQGKQSRGTAQTTTFTAMLIMMIVCTVCRVYVCTFALRIFMSRPGE